MAILIDTFSYRCRLIDGVHYFNRWASVKEHPEFSEKERLYFLNKILNSLLSHDVIYIFLDALEEFLDLMGTEATSMLIYRDELRIIDSWFYPSFMFCDKKDVVTYLNLHQTNPYDQIMARLRNKYNKSQYSFYKDVLRDKLLHEDIEYDLWDDNVQKAVCRDFYIPALRGLFGFQSENPYAIKEDEAAGFMRLLLMERSLEWASQLGTHEVLIEDKAKYCLVSKLGYKLDRLVVQHLNEALTARKIPELALLYYNKILHISDILKIRDDINGVKYREWLVSKDYNYDELTKVLMSKTGESAWLKWGRFGLVTGIGIVDTWTGVVSALVDVSIEELRKNLQKWSPQMFFDKTLSQNLKQCKVMANMKNIGK